MLRWRRKNSSHRHRWRWIVVERSRWVEGEGKQVAATSKVRQKEEMDLRAGRGAEHVWEGEKPVGISVCEWGNLPSSCLKTKKKQRWQMWWWESPWLMLLEFSDLSDENSEHMAHGQRGSGS